MLVVEDEQDLADAIAAGLRREGYAVDLAHAGDEALAEGAGLPLRPDLPRPEPAGDRRAGGLPRDPRRAARRRRAAAADPDADRARRRRRPDRRARRRGRRLPRQAVRAGRARRAGARAAAAERRRRPRAAPRRLARARPGAARGDAGGRAARADAEGVRAPPLLHDAARRGALRVRPAHPRLGREREPADADGARDRDDAAAQARRQPDRDGPGRRLPAAGRTREGVSAARSGSG